MKIIEVFYNLCVCVYQVFVLSTSQFGPAASQLFSATRGSQLPYCIVQVCTVLGKVSVYLRGMGCMALTDRDAGSRVVTACTRHSILT